MTETSYDAMKKLTELLEGFDVGMLVTHSQTGGLRARPMALADVHEDGRLSFVTSVGTAKVAEADHDARVCVTFQGSASYVSVTGDARIRPDLARLRAIWRPTWNAWFPDGPDTPGVTFFEVDSHVAEFWDSRGMKGLRYLIEAGKALLEGERVSEKGVDHRKVDVDRSHT